MDIDSSYAERGHERNAVDGRLDRLVEDIGVIVKDLHRKNKELEARNAELVLALEHGNERIMKSELAASTYRKLTDDTLRQALHALEQAEAVVIAVQGQAERNCATCTGQAAKIIMRLQSSAVSVVEQAQRGSIARHQSSRRKIADTLFAARQSIGALARQPLASASGGDIPSLRANNELVSRSNEPALGRVAGPSSEPAGSYAGTAPDADSISRLLDSLRPIQGGAAPSAEPALWDESIEASPLLLDQFPGLTTGCATAEDARAPVAYDHRPPAFPNKASPARFGPGAAPRPVARSITLVASPIRSFSMLSRFHRALKLIHGVIEATPVALDKDILRLSIKYASLVPFVDQLGPLAGFETSVLSTTEDTVEVSLAQRETPDQAR